MQTFQVDSKFQEVVFARKWTKQKTGYWQSSSPKGQERFLHRFVMELAGHVITDREVDHVNYKDLDDNRLSNLRIATRQVQGFNRGLFKNNSSGVKGVCFHNGKWQASIRVMGRLEYLGRFESKEDAETSYLKRRFEVAGF